MRLTYTEKSMIAMIDLWSMHKPDPTTTVCGRIWPEEISDPNLIESYAVGAFISSEHCKQFRDHD